MRPFKSGAEVAHSWVGMEPRNAVQQLLRGGWACSANLLRNLRNQARRTRVGALQSSLLLLVCSSIDVLALRKS